MHGTPESIICVCLAMTVFGPIPQAHASDSNSTFAATLSHTDNAGLAPEHRIKINDTFLDLALSKQYQNTISVSDSISYGAGFKLRKYNDYPYDNGSAGLNFSYGRKLGLGFNKPRVSLSWRGSKKFYNQGHLDSVTSVVGITLSKPFGEQLDTSLILEKQWEIPDQIPTPVTRQDNLRALPSSVADLEFTTLQLSAEYYAGLGWSFPLNIRRIDGDITSVSTLNLKAATESSAVYYERDLGLDWYRYRFDGTVLSSTIGASRLLADSSTLNFMFEYSKAKSNGNISYDRQLMSVNWVKSW